MLETCVHLIVLLLLLLLPLLLSLNCSCYVYCFKTPRNFISTHIYITWSCICNVLNHCLQQIAITPERSHSFWKKNDCKKLLYSFECESKWNRMKKRRSKSRERNEKQNTNEVKIWWNPIELIGMPRGIAMNGPLRIKMKMLNEERRKKIFTDRYFWNNNNAVLLELFDGIDCV